MPFLEIPVFLVTISAGYALCRRCERGEAFDKVFSLFLIAYCARIGVALFLYWLSFAKGQNGYFYGGDDLAYGTTALRIADAWRAGRFPAFLEIKDTMSISGRLGMYEYYVAGLMIISNNSTLLPIVINCSFCALGIPVLYLLCKDLYDRREQRPCLIAAGLYAFWPSLFMWSVLNLREALTLFLLLVTAFAALKVLRERIDASSLIPALVSFFLVSALVVRFRKIPGFFLFVSAFLSYGIFGLKRMYNRKRALVAVLLTVLLVAVIFVMMQAGGRSTLGEVLQRISAERDLRALGKSAIFPDLWFEKPYDLIRFLPCALCIGFLYPLPWLATSFSGLISIPEMIVWYFMIPFFARGTLLSLKGGKGAYFILFFTILCYLGLGIIEANAGTLFRHRVLVLPFSFLFITAGLQPGNIFHIPEQDKDHA